MTETNNEINNPSNNEYITKNEAQTVRDMFRRYLRSYKEKPSNMTDEEWLDQLFRVELPEVSESERKQDAKEIVDSISVFDKHYESCNKAAEEGVSKERWLEGIIQEASVGESVSEFGQTLSEIDEVLYKKNLEIANNLTRNADNQIKMSKNLDGFIAEDMVAGSTELSAFLQGKDITVRVNGSNAANSVDVTAINLKTGQRQNYQLKFGKNAKETIKLLEKGNYNNQKIIVPSEQLEEVQAYYKSKGSQKTVSDHIDAWGAKGKSFTKEEMKALQEKAQQEGTAPQLDYNHFNTKDLAMNIGKNAGLMALQSSAIMTGVNVISSIMKGEEIEPDKLVESALETGVDTGLKTVVAGTLEVAVRKGIIKFIPNGTPAGIIANIACVGIENIKIINKIASGKLSITKGCDMISRVTVSMVGGLIASAKGAAIGASLTAWIPVIGLPMSIATGFVGGMVGYFAGSKAGETLYSAAKKVGNTAKTIGKSMLNGLKRVYSSAKRGLQELWRVFQFT